MGRLRGLRLLLTGLGTALVLLGLAPAGASSANVSHSYHSTGAVPDGSIVSLDPKHSDYVQTSTTANGSRLLGVAVARNDSLLAVDPSAERVQIATSGNANALVSTVNGAINVGDQIAVSPFAGVGMKADAGSYVIGLAQTAFDGSTGATSEQVVDKSGHSSQIKLGAIRLSIAIGSGANNGGGPELNGLQRLGKSLTGRVISTPRLIISLVVTLVAILALVTLMYASIYGSIISIGRNPLAKYAVFRTLASVLGVAVLTAAVAAATLFLLLR